MVRKQVQALDREEADEPRESTPPTYAGIDIFTMAAAIVAVDHHFLLLPGGILPVPPVEMTCGALTLRGGAGG